MREFFSKKIRPQFPLQFTTTLINTYKGDVLEVAHYTHHKTLEMLTVYNDNIKQKADLPRYYRAFSAVNF